LEHARQSSETGAGNAAPESKVDATIDLRRPFEIMRACRTLLLAQPFGAEQLTTRPDVSAVLRQRIDGELLRTPA